MRNTIIFILLVLSTASFIIAGQSLKAATVKQNKQLREDSLRISYLENKVKAIEMGIVRYQTQRPLSGITWQASRTVLTNTSTNGLWLIGDLELLGAKEFTAESGNPDISIRGSGEAIHVDYHGDISSDNMYYLIEQIVYRVMER